MSEDQHQPYDDEAGKNPSDFEGPPLRPGRHYYVAGFFIALAGICFVLSIFFNNQPAPPPPPHATAASSAPSK